MTTPTERPRALTVDAAAAKLKISRRTVYRLIADGALVPVRVGNRRAVTEKSVLDYMNTNTSEYEIVDTPDVPEHLQPYARRVEKELADQAPLIDEDEPDEGAAAPCSVSSSDTENNSD